MQGVATLFENSRKVYCDSSSHTPIFRSRTDVGAGVGAEVAKNVTVDVGYRYTDYGTMSKDGYKHDTKAHQIPAGVRYSF